MDNTARRVPGWLQLVMLAIASPFISVGILVAGALFFVGNILLNIIAWPFGVLSGIADTILGGGRR